MTTLSLSALALVACKDPRSNGAMSSDASTSGSATTSSSPPKQIDLAACDAGAQELEKIAKSAKKSCQTSADCTEWVRHGNCGSVPVAMPFPPNESAARFKELESVVAKSCPDTPACKWASLGVECRAGVCAPSLEGRLDPASASSAPATP